LIAQALNSKKSLLKDVVNEDSLCDLKNKDSLDALLGATYRLWKSDGQDANAAKVATTMLMKTRKNTSSVNTLTETSLYETKDVAWVASHMAEMQDQMELVEKMMGMLVNVDDDGNIITDGATCKPV
jgi:hypothetical protein